MKTFSLLVLAATLPQIANAWTLADLAGTYKVTHPGIPAVNWVTIQANGAVSLKESSQYGNLDCKGRGTLSGDVFRSDLACQNGMSFNQTIQLGQVKNLSRFSADVFSSLYGQTLRMNFEKTGAR